MEPSPRAIRFVPEVFLLKYGWPHKQAGTRYPENEMSFRQTIHCLSRSDRGFCVIIDHKLHKVVISFESTAVDKRHTEWLKEVEKRTGLEELYPQPYWGFDDLFHKAGTKLLNCFYIQAEKKQIEGKEYFRYSEIMVLQNLSLDKFIGAIEKGFILIDFDARTDHNHGTKFRMRQKALPLLYSKTTII